MKILYTLLPLLTIFTSTEVYSQEIEFEFFNGSELTEIGKAYDNQEGSATYTIDSTTLNAEAYLNDNSIGTVINGGADGLGINSIGTGDQTQRIDNINGIDKIIFSFNTAGTFKSINLRYIEESSDEAILEFSGGNTFNLNTATALSGEDDFLINELFSAGQEITLSISANSELGENFALDSILVQIPEANTASWIIPLICILFLASSRLLKN